MKKNVKRIMISVLACAMAAFTVFGASCGASDWVEEKYDQLTCEHNTEKLIAAVEPTCTEKGASAGVECAECGKVLVAPSDISANGHTLQHYDKVEPGCLTKGLTEGEYCTSCNEWIKERREIKATGHKVVTVAAKAATCTETGLTEGEECEHCGEVYKAQETVEMIDHVYNNGKCLYCEAEEPTE